LRRGGGRQAAGSGGRTQNMRFAGRFRQETSQAGVAGSGRQGVVQVVVVVVRAVEAGCSRARENPVFHGRNGRQVGGQWQQAGRRAGSVKKWQAEWQNLRVVTGICSGSSAGPVRWQVVEQVGTAVAVPGRTTQEQARRQAAAGRQVQAGARCSAGGTGPSRHSCWQAAGNLVAGR